jgi:hypothetical protein
MSIFVFCPASLRSSGPVSRLLKSTPAVLFARVSFVLMLATAGTAAATPMSINGTFVENRGGPSNPDSFTITNESGSGLGISELHFDLSGSAGAVFDPSGAAFGVTSTDDVGFDALGVGFELTGSDMLRLSFSGFDPGESFSFDVDVDDVSSTTKGRDFDGSLLTVILRDNGTVLQGVYEADLDNSYLAAVSINDEVIPNPEPSSALLTATGLLLLRGYSRRRRAGPIAR